ncbi:MAG: amidase [Oleibacter sp.]|nr:amidase [Thalassolituus sp.]
MSKQWAFCSITELATALSEKEVSSRGLVEYFQDRISTLNPALNAVVSHNFDAALARADEADAAMARGESWGPLHGIPMTVKDTFEVVGMPCTAGASILAKHKPTTNAVTVQRLLDAGAIIYGKTNVPKFASDIQTYNKVYGQTNNPWDVTRTPGGSSGGAAASLAAGFSPIELGSDLAGSIRTPCHFCGVFGHKPSAGLVPFRGHIPGMPGTQAEPDMAVVGPMARTAGDLELMMDLLADAGPLQADGWSFQLPATKTRSKSDWKVLLWLDDPLCSVDASLKDVYMAMTESLEQAGVKVTIGAPKNVSLMSFFPTYMSMLGAVLSASIPLSARLASGLLGRIVGPLRKLLGVGVGSDEFLKGMAQSHSHWLRNNEYRFRLRNKFVTVFEQYDVVLTPVAMLAALKHLNDKPVPKRKLLVNDESRAYTDMFMWIASASLTGLPATSAPVGLTKEGLPVGIQIIGDFGRDRDTIQFAGVLEEVLGGFSAPPNF